MNKCFIFCLIILISFSPIQTEKLLAIALVDEFRSSGRFVDTENQAFHRLAESIAFTYKNVDEKFLMCYSSSIDTFNSITMHSIQPIPNFLVLNTSSIEYYLFNDGTKKISQQAIVQWLDDVVALKLEVRYLCFEGK